MDLESGLAALTLGSVGDCRGAARGDDQPGGCGDSGVGGRDRCGASRGTGGGSASRAVGARFGGDGIEAAPGSLARRSAGGPDRSRADRPRTNIRTICPAGLRDGATATYEHPGKRRDLVESTPSPGRTNMRTSRLADARVARPRRTNMRTCAGVSCRRECRSVPRTNIRTSSSRRRERRIPRSIVHGADLPPNGPTRSSAGNQRRQEKPRLHDLSWIMKGKLVSPEHHRWSRLSQAPSGRP